MDSRRGSFFWSPYTEEEDANTTRFVLLSFAARNTFTVPVIFTSDVPTGSVTEVGTRGTAARWKIPSGRCRRNTSPRRELRMSMLTNAALGLIYRFFPVLRLYITVTRAPFFTR